LETLAAELGGIVTKQALSKYEKGKARPSLVVLNKLASILDVKTAYLWSEPSFQVRFIAYRKGSGLRNREQEKIECLVREGMEERLRIQMLTAQLNGLKLPIQLLKVKAIEDAEVAAERLRSEWNLGLDPLASVTGVLEEHSIHVIEINAPEKFDGISAVAYAPKKRVVSALVVTKRGLQGERQRLNLAHELGHLFLKVSSKVNEEKAAFRFGAAFLAPKEIVNKEVGAKRSFIQPEELFLLKQRFGLSVQALLYRLRDLEIITPSYYEKWCMDINRLGWKKEEPNSLPPEHPSWFRQNVLRAFSTGLLTKEEAEGMIGKLDRGKQPLSLIERRAFLKLPLEERRRKIAEQAKQMSRFYEQRSDWKELQGGDIYEY
jgi:Zn-dependent peptidase ImmA (M78 family)/DNA-binding XRE family transcriptional regulator